MSHESSAFEMLEKDFQEVRNGVSAAHNTRRKGVFWTCVGSLLR